MTNTVIYILFCLYTEPPVVDINSDTHDATEDQEVVCTCAAVGNNITAILWSINGTACSSSPGCFLELENLTDSGGNSAITLSAGGLAGEIVVQCTAVQTLTCEQTDIVDPRDPWRLLSEVEFLQFSDSVSIIIALRPSGQHSTTSTWRLLAL